MTIKEVCDALRYCVDHDSSEGCQFCPCGGSLEECSKTYNEAIRIIENQHHTIKSLIKTNSYHQKINGILLEAIDLSEI